ncbi:AMP-dependent synthetase/ligase [Leptospira sp. GIMC2001]|uniref:AMP-dependent synthetase/ligase n=1 Tax=Leptospira sp. GIMC2001 TaxID=1513297 RepID=UPI0023497D59|nr:AMP-binding protein [Leptospira sp. GIMC2001]WCL50002.1 AMP-binding protein [Leptospira sp. GIMC2001]
MAKNLADVFRESAEKYGKNPIVWSKNKQKKYEASSYEEVYQEGLNLAEALIDMGLKARENVALLADNRKEWLVSDMGILIAGAADVPRGTDITDSEITYILNHSEAKLLFVEHDKMLEKFQKNKSECKGIKTIVMMDSESTAKGVTFLKDLIETGAKLRAKGSKKAEERVAGIKEDDVFTMIYTSGTTGQPKGVMLKHGSMIHQLDEVAPTINIKEKEERMLSILPVWHIFQRYMEYVALRFGGQSFYTNVRDLRDDFAKAKPTYMASAPRLWENIYNGIYTRVNDPKQTPAIRRGLFKLAYFYSQHWNGAKRFFKGNLVDYTGRNIFQSLGLAIKYLILGIFTGPFTMTILSLGLAFTVCKDSALAVPLYVIGGLGVILNFATLDKIVLSKIRLATGGYLKASLSGGGALPGHVDAFFNDIGIQMLEGYGMTETSPVISARNFKRPIIGSVGDLVPRAELQIRSDSGAVLTHINDKKKVLSGKIGVKGVVHVRGPMVMKGYFKNEEATKKAIKDDWMDTGDIGMINYKMTLTLTGRAKDTIVLLGGENVEPVPIENRLMESPYISQIMVCGQDQKVLGAIVVPDFDKVKEFCEVNGIEATNQDQIIENEKVIDLIKKEIKNLNNTKTGFKSFEQVTPFALVKKPFEVGDELTNLMKMKRHVITEKYSKEIKKMYKSA